MQQLTTEPARPLDTGELHAFNVTGTREILGTVLTAGLPRP